MADKKDIENRQDVEHLVNQFYEKVQQDKVIGYIFNEVVQLNWEKHIPTMYDFWETTLFQNGPYRGNAMRVHLDLDNQEPLKAEHFERWLLLFRNTVDELFSGDMAHLAKTRAQSIATVIQLKLHQKNQPAR